MEYGIIIAGSGGQGILTLGKILAYAGMVQDLNVTYYPAYGAEVRGGTAYCTVIFSDKAISSPVVSKADCLLMLNAPSMRKYFHMLKDGGLLIYNSSLITSKESENSGFERYPVPATQIAIDEGSDKVCNMVMAGLLLRRCDIVKTDTFLSSADEVMKNIDEKLRNINISAFRKGFAYEFKE